MLKRFDSKCYESFLNSFPCSCAHIWSFIVRQRLCGPLVIAPYVLNVAPAEHASHRGSTPPASVRRCSIFSTRDAVHWLNELLASCAVLGSDVSALCNLKVISQSRFQLWQNEFGDEEDKNVAAWPDRRNNLTRKKTTNILTP